MNLAVLGVGQCDAIELKTVALPPAWRRATRGMVMATVSLQKAMVQNPVLNSEDVESVGLIVGSVSGELETTADFLLTLAKDKMARPILFQNSLHNATTGFVSILQKLTGPSFTVSSGDQTAVECFKLAQTLIDGSICKYCLVVLMEVHQRLAQLLDLGELSEGACTVLVASGDVTSGLKRLSLISKSDLERFTYPQVETDQPRVALPASAVWQWGSKLSSLAGVEVRPPSSVNSLSHPQDSHTPPAVVASATE